MQIPWLYSTCTEQAAGSHGFVCHLGWDVCAPVMLQKSLQCGWKSWNLQVNEAGLPSRSIMSSGVTDSCV